MPQRNNLLDSAGAASELGVSLRRVQQLIYAGRLPAQKLGGSFVIRRADLEKVRDRKPGRPRKTEPPTQAWRLRQTPRQEEARAPRRFWGWGVGAE